MESRYGLCLDVLRRLQVAGVLNDLILIGSWCMRFYQEGYFKGTKYMPTIRTRDIDFLVPMPVRIKEKVDVTELLKDEGFIIEFKANGLMKLVHPELIVEFLVPEKGRGTDKPYPLPQLGMNAEALRYLDLLVQNSIVIESDGLRIRIPHPAIFSLHKLIVSGYRKEEGKELKDRREAIGVLMALIEQGEAEEIRRLFNQLLPSWRKKVVTALSKDDDQDAVARLSVLLGVS